MGTLTLGEEWPLGVECAWPGQPSPRPLPEEGGDGGSRTGVRSERMAVNLPPAPLPGKRGDGGSRTSVRSERMAVNLPPSPLPGKRGDGGSRTSVRNSRPSRRFLKLAAALAFGVAIWQIGQGGYIQAKAWLAQILISQAWARTLDGEQRVKPWPWADTWPVARISVPGRGIERFVLAGANGRAIAFGPGHVSGTPLPGEDGNSVIGAHRDTHFAFLRALQAGEEIVVEKSDGGRRHYRVIGAEIVDKSETRVLAQPPDETRLTLITCYPFDALRAGGPLRYVVTAETAPSPRPGGDGGSRAAPAQK